MACALLVISTTVYLLPGNLLLLDKLWLPTIRIMFLLNCGPHTMNPSEEIYPYIEQEFVRETVKRQVAKYPHSAPKIVLQLLTKLKQQSNREYDLQQKYDKLLESYLDLNEAYLATLNLLRDRNKLDWSDRGNI